MVRQAVSSATGTARSGRLAGETRRQPTVRLKVNPSVQKSRDSIPGGRSEET
jgi:hypothetical protein